MRLSPDQQCTWPGFVTCYDRAYDREAVKAETARMIELARAESRADNELGRKARAYARERERLAEERAMATRWEIGEHVYLRAPYARQKKCVNAIVVGVNPLRVLIRKPHPQKSRDVAIVEARMLRRRSKV